MVGCGLLFMALARLGSFYLVFERGAGQRLLLWATFLSFPLPFIATLTGWFTAEVGRQPDIGWCYGSWPWEGRTSVKSTMRSAKINPLFSVSGDCWGHQKREPDA
jgi:cytochrome bd-type quinol oxidase subunit 1